MGRFGSGEVPRLVVLGNVPHAFGTKPQLLRFLMLNLRPLQCWTNNLFPLDHSLTQYRGATLAIPQGLGAGSLVV